MFVNSPVMVYSSVVRTLLAYDATPGYLDTAAIPATPAKWKYRAIYRVGDNQVGLWSSEVSIMVGG